MWRLFGLGALAMTLTSCALTTMFDPQLPPITEAPVMVSVGDVWSVHTEGVFPTDVSLLPNGGFTVLDGYEHRMLVFGDDRSFVGAFPLPADKGRPARAEPSADGSTFWVTVPDRDAILRVTNTGKVVQILTVTLGDEVEQHITVAHDTGKALVVGLEDGRLAWVDRDSGEVGRTQATDVDGVPFGMIVDVQEDGPDQILVADAFGAKVHRVGATDGVPVSWVGRFGMWDGYLAKPKSATPGPDGTVVVADSELGVFEVFDTDGTPLGAIAKDGDLMRFEHPISVKRVSDGHFLALDEKTATVWGFTIGEQALATARTQAHEWRHLRSKLEERSSEQRLQDGSMCFQCHDGTILDSRQNWDPKLYHHPVDVVPDQKVPSFFPLVDGKIMCTTCHSPHGTVTVSEVKAVQEGESVTQLVRHAPQSEQDLFTRLSRKDSALCIACHSDAAHEQVLDSLGLSGTSHPTGKALADALAKRKTSGKQVAGLPKGVDASCLSCHAVHGAEHKGLSVDVTSGRICLSCHEDKGEVGHNHPLGKQVGKDRRVALAALPLADNGTQTCRTCHELVNGRTRALLQAPQTGLLCTTCHDPDKTKGPHGKVKGKLGIPCLSCHDTHDAHLTEHLLITLKKVTAADPDGCLSCHGKGGAEFEANIEPGTLGHPVGVQDLTCLSCHDAHHPDNPPPCTKCHEDQKAAFARGGHGTAQCRDCHPPHSPRPSLPASLVPKGTQINPKSMQCLACHAPGTKSTARKVAALQHPAMVFLPDGTRWSPLGKLPLYDSGGNLMSAGRNGDLTCLSCHEIHGPDGKKPGDHLRRPDWQEACSACHGDDALVLYRFFHNPEARKGVGGVNNP